MAVNINAKYYSRINKVKEELFEIQAEMMKDMKDLVDESDNSGKDDLTEHDQMIYDNLDYCSDSIGDAISEINITLRAVRWSKTYKDD